MIFLIEPLDFCKTTEVRRENLQEALALSEKIEHIYRNFGFNPIHIKTGPLEQRVEQILDELSVREVVSNQTARAVFNNRITPVQHK